MPGLRDAYQAYISNAYQQTCDLLIIKYPDQKQKQKDEARAITYAWKYFRGDWSTYIPKALEKFTSQYQKHIDDDTLSLDVLIRLVSELKENFIAWESQYFTSGASVQTQGSGWLEGELNKTIDGLKHQKTIFINKGIDCSLPPFHKNQCILSEQQIATDTQIKQVASKVAPRNPDMQRCLTALVQPRPPEPSDPLPIPKRSEHEKSAQSSSPLDDFIGFFEGLGRSSPPKTRPCEYTWDKTSLSKDSAKQTRKNKS